MRNDTIIPKIITILGPTAAGKSDTAVQLAKKIGAEVISADSMQIYKYFDIGTSKTTIEEREGIEHHLINVVEPDEDYNAGLYRKAAIKVINQLQGSNKPIIIVGGTFLYIKVLISGLIENVPIDQSLRNELEEKKNSMGVNVLHDELRQVDSVSAERIHKNDFIRIQRALEVYYLTGTKISELQNMHAFKDREFNVFKAAISADREIINQRINGRVDQMMAKGLVEEVEEIRSMGYGPELKPMKSIGYKEINQLLDNALDYDSAVDLIKRDTRRFAKRQTTWLRSEPEVKWYDINDNKKKFFDDAMEFYGI